MNVRIGIDEQPCLEVGDAVVAKDKFYIVRVESGQYIARCINDGYGLTGLHGTLRKLQESLEKENAKIYPKSKYELVLREKR